MRNSKITVWYLIGNLEIGGTERTLIELANGLECKQYDVTVWTIEDVSPLVKEIKSHVTYKSLHASGKSDFLAILKFIRVVQETKPDIIQSFLFYDNLLAVLGGIVSDETHVITGVRAVPTEPSTFRDLTRRVIHPLADCTVSNSESGADFITERGVASGDVCIVKNGRDLDTYRSGSASADLQKSLQIPADARVVGTVGRLIERKGHYDLMNAWSKVVESNPNAHLLFVGDGPEMRSLDQLASQNRIHDSVHLAGERKDIPELLDLMDVFVFPSHFEGFPGALIEAMAAGLPIITTPVNGNSELVTDGETGLVVSSKSPTELANQINHLLADPHRAEKLGERAAIEVEGNYSTEQMVNEFETIYERLLFDDRDVYNNQ